MKERKNANAHVKYVYEKSKLRRDKFKIVEQNESTIQTETATKNKKKLEWKNFDAKQKQNDTKRY